MDNLEKDHNITRSVWPLRFIAVLFFTVLTSIVAAQEKPKTTLLYDLEILGCEDLLARSDQLGMKLKEDPTDSAFVIVYGRGDMSKKADIYAKFIQNALIGRYDNNFNVTIARSTDRDSLAVEAWLVPQGVIFEKPNVTVVAKIPFVVDKKALFSVETGDPCSNHIARGFSNALKSNPGAMGYVVDFNTEKKKRVESTQEWLNFFRELGIPLNRVRIFFKNTRMSPYNFPHSEYWLLPAKKK